MTKLKITTNKSFAQNSSMDKSSVSRLFYLDWLRVIAILFVFFVHSAKIFDYHTTVMFNEARSMLLTAFREFTLVWVMPFFFVVSGAAIFLASRLQSTGGFLKSRVKRILVPGLLVGTFIINPIYVYVEKLFSGSTISSFIIWYPSFFDGLYVTGKGNFAPWGMGTHLWYLQYLFVFSLILLPLFIRSGKKDASLLERASKAFERPWALFLLFVPVSAVAYMFEIIGLGGVRMTGSWDMISYMMFLMFGYMIYSNIRIQKTIGKHTMVFVVGALVLSILYLAAHFGIGIHIFGVTRHNIFNGDLLPSHKSIWAIVQVYRGLMAWVCILAILGLGRRFLNHDGKLRVYANQMVLPFYILHHSVIYVVGFFVIQQGLGVGLKFVTVSIVAFTVIMVIYEAVIRQFNLVRVLFGMKVS